MAVKNLVEIIPVLNKADHTVNNFFHQVKGCQQIGRKVSIQTVLQEWED
jgi:hypothetical protein